MTKEQKITVAASVWNSMCKSNFFSRDYLKQMEFRDKLFEGLEKVASVEIRKE